MQAWTVRAQPWLDRSGKLSALKLATFVVVLAPGIWIAAQWEMGALGPRPVTEAIHQVGDWAVRLLLVSLLITPLRYVVNWPRAVVVRRMIGVAAAAYAFVHFCLYILDQKFDLVQVASEIVLRIYLTIGFVALIGLLVLSATSTDAAIRKLGAARWNGLHRLVYPIAGLALIHFMLQKKLDVTEPVLMWGFLFWLLGFRLMRRFSNSKGLMGLLALAVIAAVLTAFSEAGWYALATGAPAQRVLAANLDFSYSIRPAWWVLGAGLMLALASFVRPSGNRRRQPPRAAMSRA